MQYTTNTFPLTDNTFTFSLGIGTTQTLAISAIPYSLPFDTAHCRGPNLISQSTTSSRIRYQVMVRSFVKRLRSAINSSQRGHSYSKQICPPILPGQWRPGMPCHWNEGKPFTTFKFRLLRFAYLLQIIVGVIYFRYRINYTIGTQNTKFGYLAYQIGFLCLELFSFFVFIMRSVENWNMTNRNCADFLRIPPHFISRTFSRSRKPHGQYKQSIIPTVDVFIPCYNEDVTLVQQTVLGALNIDYPEDLMNVYLCDDGKDISKKSLVGDLRRNYSNVHYVTRPDNNHAKAGNLNYHIKRTSGDFIVVLDADFIPRPLLVQRLMPYYFNWNPVSELYELDEKLAAIQSPQQFRNISPYDPDPLDQRATSFMELAMPSKDWFDSAPIIGTSNLISRAALQQIGLFPHHSVTEDTALSLNFHRNGLKTYYVNESLSSGLAPTSLWSCFDQRERWLKGDWQIFLSKDHSPLRVRGLSLVQRIMYINMALNRLQSITGIFLDLSCFMLLALGIPMLEVHDSHSFVAHLLAFYSISVIVRSIRVAGSGLFKSDVAGLLFETMFRFVALKGLIIVLMKGTNIKFKVTDKPTQAAAEKKKPLFNRDWWKNLNRATFNVFISALLIFSIWWALRGPTWLKYKNDHHFKTSLVMAIGFTFANLLPHLLCVYLCFKPLLHPWMMKDLIHGRCDQYATDPVTGKAFVPRSYISKFGIFQMLIVFGPMLLYKYLVSRDHATI